MFSGSLMEMDTNQKMLMYWCKFYNQHVFSLDENERPAEYIVDYDVLLDHHLDRKRFLDKSKTSGRARASANEMQEVIEF
jgi:hypothetical protein